MSGLAADPHRRGIARTHAVRRRHKAAASTSYVLL